MDLLAVPEKDESRHGADAQFLGDVGGLVDVDLVEFDILKFVGHLHEFRGDHLARTAPGGEAVEHHKTIVLQVDDGGLEGGLVGKIVDRHFGG